jgi:large subunit ribosomal protein L10
MKTTGFSRVSKDLIIKEIEKELKKGEPFFIARHDLVPANNIDKLRKKLRGAKTRYLVVKNTLGQKAFEKAKLADFSGHVQGACGIAFTSGDAVSSSKALMEFSKENENFKVQAGYMQGKMMSVDQIKVLASLPSREVLLAKVVGQMQAPISGFVNVLAGTLRKFVNVVDAIQKKKSQS